MTYEILPAVDAIPPVVWKEQSRDDWSHAYKAAREAQGKWVPIDMKDRTRARNLVYVAKKRKGFEAEQRNTTVYLRSVA